MTCEAAIYHLALASDWESARADGAYRVSTLGRTLEEEGFVHCCFASQVQRTADLFYRGRDDVVLLKVDPGRLRSEVRLESAVGTGERFPHVYGPLDLCAVVEVAAVPLEDASAPPSWDGTGENGYLCASALLGVRIRPW